MANGLVVCLDCKHLANVHKRKQCTVRGCRCKGLKVKDN